MSDGFLRRFVIGLAGMTFMPLGVAIYTGGGGGDTPSILLYGAGGYIVIATVLLILDYALQIYSTSVAIAMLCVIFECYRQKAGSGRMRLALGVSSVFGCVDGLIPLLFQSDEIDLELATRILDSVFYLPLIVWALKRYDLIDVDKVGHVDVDVNK